MNVIVLTLSKSVKPNILAKANTSIKVLHNKYIAILRMSTSLTSYYPNNFE